MTVDVSQAGDEYSYYYEQGAAGIHAGYDMTSSREDTTAKVNVDAGNDLRVSVSSENMSATGVALDGAEITLTAGNDMTIFAEAAVVYNEDQYGDAIVSGIRLGNDNYSDVANHLELNVGGALTVSATAVSKYVGEEEEPHTPRLEAAGLRVAYSYSDELTSVVINSSDDSNITFKAQVVYDEQVGREYHDDFAAAIYLDNAEFSLTGKDGGPIKGTLNLEATGANVTYGLFAEGSGMMTKIYDEEGEEVDEGKMLSLDVSGGINISAHSRPATTQDDFYDSEAVGIYLADMHTASIHTDGDFTISAQSSYEGRGIVGEYINTLNLSAKNLSISSIVSPFIGPENGDLHPNYSYGFEGYGENLNIDVKETLSIKAEGGHEAYGIYSDYYQTTKISAETIDIQAKAGQMSSQDGEWYDVDGEARGAEFYGQDLDIAAETITVAALGFTRATGMEIHSDDSAKIVAKDITVTAEAGWMSPHNEDYHTQAYGEAMGLQLHSSWNEETGTLIKAETLTVSASGLENATGMENNGYTTLDADNISITAESGWQRGDSEDTWEYGGGYATGLRNGGELIINVGKSLLIESTNDPNSGGAAFEGSGRYGGISSNTNINFGDGGVTMVISAKLAADLPDWVEPGQPVAISLYNSHFNVQGGTGKDYVEINGDINMNGQSSVNIDLGAGNDTLSLNGAINGNAFYVSGGEGEDLLILHAPDAETFNEWYGGWLEGLDHETLQDMSFESIRIDGVDNPAELSWFLEMIKDYNESSYGAESPIDLSLYNSNGEEYHAYSWHQDTYSDGNDFIVLSAGSVTDGFSLNGGDGDDTLYVNNFESAGSLADFTQHASSISGVEALCLDLDGQSRLEGFLDGALGTLGQLFSSLSEVTNDLGNAANLLFNNVSEADMQTLENGGWLDTGATADFNGQTYATYEHEGYGQLYIRMMTE